MTPGYPANKIFEKLKDLRSKDYAEAFMQERQIEAKADALRIGDLVYAQKLRALEAEARKSD